MLAKQSTVLTVVVGPILDSTGAEYASAVIGDLSISKNGGTLTAMASAATLTYLANGMYTLVTTTGNMDTLGAVQVTCSKATYQMPKMERNVVPASVYDAIIANATNATGGLLTATAAITGLAGTISTYAGGAVASVTGSVGSISGVSFPANFSSLGITAGGAIAELGPNALAANDLYSPIADAVWDEILTGATHNIASSAGRRLRQLASVIVRAGTAQGPGTGNNQIQLDAGASATNGEYDPGLIFIETGTGAGQARLILQYNGSTKVATVDRDWRINPDNTSEFVILADAGRNSVNEGLAQGGTSTTITLNASASATDDAYNGQLVFIRSGTGQDQVGLVEDYVGSTKVATIRTRSATGQWATVPDTTSAYMMIPNLTFTLSEISGAVASTQALSRLDSMIESDGSGQFRFDTIALSMAPAGGGGGNQTINVYPVSASTPERVAGTTITYYRNEIRSVSVVTDFTLTSLTLSLTIEDAEGTDLLTIPNGSISRSNQTFTVSIGTAVTSSVGNKRWALRDITGGTNSVIARGVFSVQEAASA
jgi:hypothetical protein